MKFILIADDNKSLRSFFPIWEVIIFVLFVLFLLFLFFPKHLFEKTLNSTLPSAVTLSYLQAYSKIYPQNIHLHLDLIEQEINLGQLHNAEVNIERLKKMNSSTAEISNQLLWFDYLMLRYKTFYETKSNTSERIDNLKKLRVMAKTLTTAPLKRYQLRSLAKDSFGIGIPMQALNIYDHLLKINALTTPEELAEGGVIAMQNNAHRESSKFYWAAYKISKGTNKQKYAIKAIQVLWAGNLVSEAAYLADQLPDNMINDRDTLTYLSRLALAANRPDIAQKYVIKALLTKSNDKHE